MEDIAARVGITPAALYRHSPSKYDLFRDAVLGLSQMLVDVTALEAAMRSGKVLGAGLDVLPQEPGDLEHPLMTAWRKGEDWIKHRLIVTPHAAFYSPASMIDLRLKSVEVVHAYLAEGRLTNCVNAEYLKK